MNVKIVLAVLGLATVIAEIYLEKEKMKNLEKPSSNLKNVIKNEVLEVIPI